MYDEKLNKLRLYDEGEWLSFLINTGMNKLIKIIQHEYLNAYEVYLIKKTRDTKVNFRDKQEIKEHIYAYYHFLGCFDIDPYVKNQNDQTVLAFPEKIEEFKSEKFEIQEHFIPRYEDIKSKITKSDVAKTKKEVLDIIKRNSKNNIADFNKKIISLVQMDDEFKETVVNMLGMLAI
jgi:uncharacterized protein YPO0396